MTRKPKITPSRRSLLATAADHGADRSVGGIRLIRTLAGICLLLSVTRIAAAAEEPAISSGEPTAHETAAPVFDLDVMAVLSRAGCNQGVCHGNQNGKGGFYLSLRGEDPEFDYRSLTDDLGSRRINRIEPAQSLVLLKATADIAHRGGKRFDVDSREYEILLNWIQNGSRRDEPARDVVRLEASPPSLVLRQNQSSDLTAIAHYSDGTQAVVDDLSIFSSSNPAVEIAQDGQLQGDRLGESTILIRHLQHQVAVDVAVIRNRPEMEPGHSASHGDAGDQPGHSIVETVRNTNNPIDDWVNAKLTTLELPPAPLCDDTTFLRRATMDALGRLPTVDEALRFLDDERPDKRERWIDALLARPEFADYWALKWSDVLRNEEKVLDQQGVIAFHGWIRDSIAHGLPLDMFARELVSSRGSTYDEPPANYYRALRDPLARGEATARLFLGVRLQCAKCHNHPFERWTQADYYSWAGVFSRIDYEIVENNRRDKYDKNEFVGEQIVKIVEEGYVTNPRTGDVAEPLFLGDGHTIDESERDRLLQLADWITVDRQKQFAEVQANFVWYHLLGRGIVEPVDDFRATNPPSNRPLLAGLSQHLIDNDFDLKALVRLIMTSHTYQRSSVPLAENRHDERNFAYAIVRRLPAEPLLDAQNQVLGTRSPFAIYPDAETAVGIPGAQVRRPDDGDRFLMQFGKPTRLLGCECERATDTTLSQAFELISGEHLQERLTHDENQLARWLASDQPLEEVIEQLYWRSLSRPPSAPERAAAARLVESASSPSEGLQDLAWALLNSKEFLFRR